MPSTVEIITLDELARANATPGSIWHPGDFEFFDSYKAMSKVRRNLNQTKHNFDIKVVVSNSIADSRKHGDALPIDPQAINVRLANNVTTERNWIPMTSWILLHRLSHCFVSGHDVSQDGLFDGEFRRVDGPEFALFAGLDDIWWDAYFGLDGGKPSIRMINNGRHYVPEIRGSKLRIREQYKDRDEFSCFDGRLDDIPRHGLMAMYFMTMRSAREKALSNELDIFAEAFAQFLHTGRFRMNRWVESGLEDLGHPGNFVNNGRTQQTWGIQLKHDLTKRMVSVEYLDQRISEIEEEINAKMTKLAARMVGKVFSF